MTWYQNSLNSSGNTKEVQQNLIFFLEFPIPFLFRGINPYNFYFLQHFHVFLTLCPFDWRFTGLLPWIWRWWLCFGLLNRTSIVTTVSRNHQLILLNLCWLLYLFIAGNIQWCILWYILNVVWNARHIAALIICDSWITYLTR